MADAIQGVGCLRVAGRPGPRRFDSGGHTFWRCLVPPAVLVNPLVHELGRLSLGPKTVLHGLANLGRLIGGRPLLGLASLDPLLGHAGGGRYQRPEQVADVAWASAVGS